MFSTKSMDYSSVVAIDVTCFVTCDNYEVTVADFDKNDTVRKTEPLVVIPHVAGHLLR